MNNMDNCKLIADHLIYEYDKSGANNRRALDDVSFVLHPGEFVGLIGHTGSGKSTLVQHLNALLKPDSGSIYYEGADIFEKDYNRKALRGKVGLVFQYPEYQLFEETVAKDIAFGPKNLGLKEAEIDERVRTAMAQVHLNYDKYAQRSPFELSGGQMRRVAIAGVLAMRPSTLILDEPTAGLDPHGRDRILGIVRELHQSGTTVVMVSHSMDDVARLATRVVVLSHGALLADGTPREIFRQRAMMEEAGLGVPEASRLVEALRARGLDLPDDLYTQEELRDHLLRLWQARKEGRSC